MHYDLVLIHPPVIYDFRNRPLFPGALGTTAAQVQLTKVPIGMLSIAEYLDRHGYKVVIDNIGDRMAGDIFFDAEEHIRNTSSRIYAIGLHFHHHAQGAMEMARLCKKLHPDSIVLMGGLTATRFHDEIIKKYEFVDYVIRGEAEKPLLELVRAVEKGDKSQIKEIPNLTYRDERGEVKSNPLMIPSQNLDEFEFTRIDLLEPKDSVFNSGTEPRGSLEVCRGCIYNCDICGGSAHAYRTHLGRSKPAFRSPARIVEDMRKFRDQGIKVIGLYQDPRMGGERYWKELMEKIRNGGPDIDRLTFDIFDPVDEEFVREVATLKQQVVFYMCPDSGTERIRAAHGRRYTNEELLGTIKLCYRYHIPVTSFFSIGLAGETEDSINDTFSLCDELFRLEKAAIDRWQFGRDIPLGGPITSYVFLDPGSLAFDFPEKLGYKLLFKNLEEIIDARNKPSWHQWLNYETGLLDTDKLISLIIKSIDVSTSQREKYGAFGDVEAYNRRLMTSVIRFSVDEINSIFSGDAHGKDDKDGRLASLNQAIEAIFNGRQCDIDKYGYYRKMMGRQEEPFKSSSRVLQ